MRTHHFMRNYDTTPGTETAAAQQQGASGLRIVAIGDAGHDRATNWAKFQYPIHILVKNVPDLVTKVIQHCSQQRASIRTLVIVGHGAPGQQQIGYVGEGGQVLDVASLVGPHFNGTWRKGKRVFYPRPAGPSRELMARLIPFFMPDGEVILGGCDVGEEPEVARALAQLLHVRVTAYSAQQVIPLNSVWVGKETVMNKNGGLEAGVTSNLPFHVR